VWFQALEIRIFSLIPNLFQLADRAVKHLLKRSLSAQPDKRKLKKNAQRVLRVNDVLTGLETIEIRWSKLSLL
jgi:hypothetical protein